MARKGECIYKRKDGRWEARFVKENEFGQKQLVSVYAKKYLDVKNKRNEIIRNSTFKSINAKQCSFILSDLSALWLEHIQGRIALSSYQKYEGIIRNHVIPHLGGLRPHQISRTVLMRFSNDLLREGNLKKPGGLSARSVNSVLIVVGLLFKWASEWLDLPVVKIPFIREPRTLPFVLSRTDQAQLESYAHVHSDVFVMAMLFSLYTGLRIGEVCALHWEDVSEDVLFVHRSLQRIKNKSGHWELLLAEPKTHNSCRTIPIPERLKPYLQEHRKPSGYVFLQQNGRLIEPRLMQSRASVIFNRANVSVKNFHSLRHTFATRLIDCGSDPKTVSELLGHSSVQITLNKYVHPSFDMKKKAIDLLCDSPTVFVSGQDCGRLI